MKRASVVFLLTLSLLSLFVGSGPAQALASNFDEDDEGWGSARGASLSWEPSGGDPCGYLQGEDLGGEGAWYYVSPRSWSGDWTGYIDGKLSFDLRLIIAGGGEGFSADLVRIYGPEGSFVSCPGNPPEGTWTHYQVDLSSSSFNTTDREFRKIMRNVDRIWIRGEYSDGKDAEGLDNVVVELPRRLHLVSTFDEGDEGWRPANDVKLSWKGRGGNVGGFLEGEDLGDGTVWYYVSPGSWSGDWTPYIGGELGFDLKLIDSSQGEESFDSVRIYGAGGKFASCSIDPPRKSWTHREVELSPAKFGVPEDEFREIMKQVDQLWIRGEYGDGMDTEGLDNVMVTRRSEHDLISTFDFGDEGWRPGNDVNLSWEAEGGNPGGYLKGEDLATGGTWYYITPEDWSGDWRPYVGGRLSFDLKVMETGDGDVGFGGGYTVRIYGPDRTFLSWSEDPPEGSWTHYEVPLTPQSFGSSEELFDQVMGEVERVRIRGEYSNMRDVEGLDNVIVSGAEP